MTDRAQFDGRGVLAIEAIMDVEGPLSYRVADVERLVLLLPPCDLSPLSPEQLVPVAVRPVPAVVRLPRPDAAVNVAVPDATWQGWRWPTGEQLLLSAYQDPELPGLRALPVPPADACRMRIAGRPMLVRRFSPEDADSAGSMYAAEVAGFLDDRTHFLAQIRAPSSAQCERLLVALTTIVPGE